MSTLGTPCKLTPYFYGSWANARGNSEWQPLGTYYPGLSNPERQYSWQQILTHFGLSGIDYYQSLPDFDPIRTTNNWLGIVPDSLIIFTRITGQRWRNFPLADAAAINNTGLTLQDMQQFRYAFNLTWHEEYNTTEMRLVFAIVHNNMSHTGGIAVINHHGHGSTGLESSEIAPLPIWHDVLGDGWQYENVRYFQRKTSEGLTLQLVFGCEANQDLAPQQVSAFQFLQKHQDAFRQMVAIGLKEALQQLREARSDAKPEEPSPETTTLAAISFLLMQPNDRNCIGILYDCSLDTEHGLGILLEQTEDGYQILRTGDQSVAL